MIDYFALLGQPRQPHLEPTALESKFRERAASLHPDAGGVASDAFVALNQAFTSLRNPRLRLQHLLALEGVEQKQNSLPQDWVDLFSRAAEVASRTRNELRRQRTADNAITRSMRQIDCARICEDLNSLLQELEMNETEAETDLKRLNEQWSVDRAAAIENVRRLQQRFTFVQRWIANVRELQFQLQN